MKPLRALFQEHTKLLKDHVKRSYIRMYVSMTNPFQPAVKKTRKHINQRLERRPLQQVSSPETTKATTGILGTSIGIYGPARSGRPARVAGPDRHGWGGDFSSEVS